MTVKDLVKKLQIELNKQGESLSLDGDFGPKTEAALNKYDLTLSVSKKPVSIPILDAGDFKIAPWLKYGLPLMGLSEYTQTLNDILVPWWAKVGLPQFKNLRTSEHAWCALFIDWLFNQAGFKGTGSAAAASFRTWGKQCPFWFGSVLSIQHASGGNHVTCFLYWVDEANKKAACFGGNQGDEVRVSVYDLSGNAKGKDEVKGGPRWPIGFSDGVFLSPDEAKKLISSIPKEGGGTR